MPQTGAPAPSAYPNSAQGLRTFLNDLLTATKNGDSKTVDVLIKQTEFPDYGQWFLHTYSPDPLTADGWAASYAYNVGRNEGLFRELLATLAKDDGSTIFVRKVNDGPEPNNGLERGMVRYARTPVDVYSATLSSPSGNEPIERRGYFVYADGMFRWENLADFAKPDTYVSEPAGPLQEGRPAFSGAGPSAETTASIKYPNTPDGLRSFLSDVLGAARNEQHSQVKAMIEQSEIPDYRNWYCSMFIPGSALGWAKGYGKGLDVNEKAFEELWQKLATDDGEILVRKLADKPGGPRGFEWGMLHNSRKPVDIYHATWKSAKGAPDGWIGYFYYVDGMFRWDSTAHEPQALRLKTPPKN